MDQGDVPGSSPTSAPGLNPEGEWRAFAGLLACCVCAPLVAYDWAAPCEAGALASHLERLVFNIVPVWGVFLIFITSRGHLRSGLLLLLTLMLAPLIGTVPLVGAAIGGWPGGWALGVAGFVAGAAYGWLSVWLLRLGRRLIDRRRETVMRDSRLGFARFRPISPWALRGYLAVLVAGAVAILLGVRFGSDLSSLSFLGICLGVYGLVFVVADLLRHVATLGREIEKLKEQSPDKPAEASLTPPPGDLSGRVARILKAHEAELYLAPSIPPKKLANARAKACVPADENVLGLIDCTVLGSASACLVFGSRGFYYSDGNSNPGSAGSSTLAQDRETRTAILGTPLDRFGKLGPKLAELQSKIKEIGRYVPGSVAYSEFPGCRFTKSGLFYIRLDKHRYFNQSGSRVSRGKLIDILDAIKQAVVEVAEQSAEGGGGTEISA